MKGLIIISLILLSLPLFCGNGNRIEGIADAGFSFDPAIPKRISDHEFYFVTSNQTLVKFNIKDYSSERIFLPFRDHSIRTLDFAIDESMNRLIMSDLTIVSLLDHTIDTSKRVFKNYNNMQAVNDYMYANEHTSKGFYKIFKFHNLNLIDSVEFVNEFFDFKVLNDGSLILIEEERLVKYDFEEKEEIFSKSINNGRSKKIHISNDKLILPTYSTSTIEFFKMEDFSKYFEIKNNQSTFAGITDNFVYYRTGSKINRFDLNSRMTSTLIDDFHSNFYEVSTINDNNFIIHDPHNNDFIHWDIENNTRRSLMLYNQPIDKIFEFNNGILYTSIENPSYTIYNAIDKDFNFLSSAPFNNLVTETRNHNHLDKVFFTFGFYNSPSLYEYNSLKKQINLVNEIDASGIKEFAISEETDRILILNEDNQLKLIEISTNIILNEFTPEKENDEIKKVFAVNGELFFVLETIVDGVLKHQFYRIDNENKVEFFIISDDTIYIYENQINPIKVAKDNEHFYYWSPNYSKLVIYNYRNKQYKHIYNMIEFPPFDLAYDMEIDLKNNLCVIVGYKVGVYLYRIEGNEVRLLRQVVDSTSYRKFNNEMLNKPTNSFPLKLIFSNDSKHLFVNYIDGSIEKIDISEFVSVKEDNSYETENQQAIIASNNKFIIPNNLKYGINSISEFFNITGRKIDIKFEVTYDDKYLQYEFLNKLPRGIYFLKISSSTQNKTIKILQP